MDERGCFEYRTVGNEKQIGEGVGKRGIYGFFFTAGWDCTGFAGFFC